MNIDELLRAAARDVAARATDTTPDLTVIRQRVRRRRLVWAAGAGAAAVVVAAVAVGSPSLNLGKAPDPANRPPAPSSTSTGSVQGGDSYAAESPAVLPCCLPEQQPMRPGGSYRVDPMLAGANPPLGLTLPGSDWVHFGAWTSRGGTGLSSVVELLISDVEGTQVDVCDSAQGFRDPGADAAALGQRLAGIEQLTVLDQPQNLRRFGYPAVHLRLQGPLRSSLGGCPDRHVGLWAGGEDFNMNSGLRAARQIRDLLLLDVDGQILAIEQTWFRDTPAAEVDALHALTDSLTYPTN